MWCSVASAASAAKMWVECAATKAFRAATSDFIQCCCSLHGAITSSFLVYDCTHPIPSHLSSHLIARQQRPAATQSQIPRPPNQARQSRRSKARPWPPAPFAMPCWRRGLCTSNAYTIHGRQKSFCLSKLHVLVGVSLRCQVDRIVQVVWCEGLLCS
jgi:hypothetical protein